MTLNNTTNVQNKPGVCVVDRIDSNGTLKSTSVREYIAFTGTSGATLTGLTRNADNSSSDQDHATGAVVEFIPDVLWAQSVVDALANMVDITDLSVDTTKVVTPTGTQTLTNKTLTAPTINSGTGMSLTLINTVNRNQFLSLADASIMYLDFSAGSKWKATIVPDGARTFLATNATVGDIGILRVNYASTASLALGLLNSAASIGSVRWPGGNLPTPTATVGKGDEFGFVMWDSTPVWDAVTISQNH